MNFKVKGAAVVVLLLSTPILFSQSLVEIAKKEKERRAKLKGRKSIVVTNAVLARKKREPAITIKSGLLPLERAIATSSAPGARPLEDVTKQMPSEVDREPFVDIKSLEQRVQEAQEQVALLTLKMNVLWQKFSRMDAMTPRGLIQKQISETYLQLQKAKKEAEDAEKQLKEARRKTGKQPQRK